MEEYISIIPRPAKVSSKAGRFVLADSAVICVNGSNEAETYEIYETGHYLASKLRPATGLTLDVVKTSNPPKGSIYLAIETGAIDLGNEGYRLEVAADGIVLSAFKPEGLFRGIQTIRQLLPADIEQSTVVNSGCWAIPCVSITDNPEYPWRGMMLDVTRHFFKVDDVKRIIDLMAQYKLNKFHLHLTDDQGWRIHLKSRPMLTEIGSKSQVGGGTGGFYTQEEYAEIINYAKARYIDVIPEIDTPGHCNAALASYAELNADGIQKELYTGTEVGFSSFMCRDEKTYAFLNDVLGELASMTPGEYIHIGGDEALSTSKEDYAYFISRVNDIVENHGKKPIGWTPYDTVAGLPEDALLQKWTLEKLSDENKDIKVIMSPPNKTYLDMKYYEDTPIGLKWAGLVSTEDSYKWDPADSVPKENIIGVECPLWTETVETMASIEYLTFPRLIGNAEAAWTPKELRDWDEYKLRLKAHGQRMKNQGISYFDDPCVQW